METQELRDRLDNIERKIDIIGSKLFREFPELEKEEVEENKPLSKSEDFKYQEKKEREAIDKITEDKKETSGKKKATIKFKDEKEY